MLNIPFFNAYRAGFGCLPKLICMLTQTDRDAYPVLDGSKGVGFIVYVSLSLAVRPDRWCSLERQTQPG